MPFQAILKNLVETVPGAVGAILVDWEGEAVQEYCHCAPYDIRFVAAHKAVVLARLRESHNNNYGGTIEEVAVSSEQQHLLIGVVDPDYSLVLQVQRPVSVALVRHHFNAALQRIREVM